MFMLQTKIIERFDALESSQSVSEKSARFREEPAAQPQSQT
jgi:hypothetical protein